MDEQRGGPEDRADGEERDAYLREQRTCRVATVGPHGRPHVSALWFVWDGSALWLNSLTNSQRWANLLRAPAVSVLVDSGHDFLELAGVELIGDVEVVGDVPRTDAPHPELETPGAGSSATSTPRAGPASPTTAGTPGCGWSPRRS